MLNVNDHRLKAVASGYGLKPDWVGPGGRLANWLDDFEVVVGNLRLLILNIFLPHLVRHVATRGHPIAPSPQMLTPIPFAKRLIFRQQFVRALAFQILHRPKHRQMRRYPYQHMHMVAIDRSSVDRHLMRPRDFTQQLPRPLPDIAAQHRKPVLCYPHDRILAVPDRVTSGLRILHTRSVASQSPKGEGFTDPKGGTLNERSRRLFAANEAQTAGRGGLAAVYEATGIARSTIGRGLSDLRNAHGPLIGRIRRPGGGRKPKTETEAGLVEALGDLVQSAIRGDPEAALLWVSKSQRHLVRALADRGYTASQKLVGRLLRDLGFSLQANKKTLEGARHPDRDAQFEHINQKIKDFQSTSQPAISVDTKKKELVGDFKNGGREEAYPAVPGYPRCGMRA